MSPATAGSRQWVEAIRQQAAGVDILRSVHEYSSVRLTVRSPASLLNELQSMAPVDKQRKATDCACNMRLTADVSDREIYTQACTLFHEKTPQTIFTEASVGSIVWRINYTHFVEIY